MSDYRIGHGYDLHRLAPLSSPVFESGKTRPVRPLVVGGVLLDGPGVDGGAVGVIAHSDGDVLLHALTDAVLGALAFPDIGQLFPDSAEENEGRDSAVFVREAASRAQKAGWAIANIDATVILERPRIGPVKAAMMARIAELLDIPPDVVNIKGKSHEGVDATGEGRAIEAHCVVLLHRVKRARRSAATAPPETPGE